MKRLLVLSLLFSFALQAFSQNEKYVKAMEAKVAGIDTARTPAAMTSLSNDFLRIAETEKTQWLPYYYAALANILHGYYANDPAGNGNVNLDAIADRSEELINKAIGLTQENSEIWVVKKMIATLRMTVDPQTRWQTYGAAAAEALNKARQLDPENPRVYLLEGQDKFYTPEQFGGSKTEAQKLFQTSLDKFAAGKQASSISPRWGKASAEYFLGLSKQ